MKKLKILVYMHLNLASTLYPSSSQISERSFLSTEFEDILRVFNPFATNDLSFRRGKNVHCTRERS